MDKGVYIFSKGISPKVNVSGVRNQIPEMYMRENNWTRCRKWTQRLEFKSRSRLFVFYIVLMKGMNPIILSPAMDK